MTMPRNTQTTILRVNTLAACLALALGTCTVAASATNTRLPLSNHSTSGEHTSAAARPALRNQPNAGRVPARSRSFAQRTATIISVTNCNDSGSGSMRAAIGTAGPNDTIDLSGLSCSTITLSSGKIDIGPDDITLYGGASGVTIDGSNNQIFNALGNNLTIDGLTLANGNFPYGGCVYTKADLTLKNSTITGCTAGDPAHAYTYGGGIDVRGDLTMVNSTVTGNAASGSQSAFGGGVYVRGTATISDSVISNNVASAKGADGTFNIALGGGLATIDGMNVSRTTIADNRAESLHGHAYGGGIIFLGTLAGTTPIGRFDHGKLSGNLARSGGTWSYGGGIAAGFSGIENQYPLILAARSASVAASYSSIQNNTASSDCSNCVIVGGGISAFGQVTLDHSTVSGNKVLSNAGSSATAYGGGVVTRFDAGGSAAGTITVSESTISGNSALGRAGGQGGYGRGGGVAALLSPAVISNSTVAFNVASTSGGGVIVSPSTDTDSTLQSSIVANNEAPMARDIGLAVPFSNNTGVTVLGGHNLVQSASANLALPNDTLYVDPGLQALALNGGPTETHALWPNSPALNAGSNPNNDACDQRGVPYSRLFGTGVDIGAFESTGVPTGDVIFRNGFELTGCVAPPPAE